MKNYKIILALLALFFISPSMADTVDATVTNEYRVKVDSSSTTIYATSYENAADQYATARWGSIASISIELISGTSYYVYVTWNSTGTTDTYTITYITLVAAYSYSCDDGYILDDNGTTCTATEDDDSFVIDEDTIQEYLDNASNAVGTYEFCTTSSDGLTIDCVMTDDAQALLDLIDGNIETQEDEIETQTDDYSSILSDSATLDAAIDEDSDSISLAAAETIVDNLADDTATLLSESTDLNSESDDLADSASVYYDSASDSLYESEEAFEEYTSLVTDLSNATTQTEYDSILTEMQTAGYCDGSYCGDFSNITSSLDDAEDDIDEITTISSTVDDNTTTIINNTTTTTTNSETSSTVTSSVTSTTTTDSDDSDEDSDSDSDSDFTLDSSTTDYESFSDVMTNFYDSVDGSPIASAFSSFSDVITVPTGSCPTFSMDLTNTPINASLSTTLHCDLWDDVSDIISGCMMVVWCFAGFRIVAGA